MASHNNHSFDGYNAHSTSATGHSRRFCDFRDTSALPPIATKLQT